MIKKFRQYNESLTDKMTPKSDKDINLSLDGYIQKLENILKSEPYDDSEFGAEKFLDFISNYYGCETSEDVVIKLMELEYITPSYILSDWVDGVDSVSGYSEEDGKEQIKNFLETIKRIKNDKEV